MIKHVNGQILWYGFEVRRRLAEYFEQVLNVEDVREVNINAVRDRWMSVLRELNERAILIEEVREAVKEMKSKAKVGIEFHWSVYIKVVWHY